MISFFGSALTEEIAIGYAHVLDADYLQVEHYFIHIDEISSEIQKFEQAIHEVQNEFKSLKDNINDDAPEEISAFLDVHLLILQDHTLCKTPKDLIAQKRYNASWALTHQLEILMQQFDGIEDEYLRERKYDVQQVVEKVLKVLAGQQEMKALEQDTIIISHDLAPSDLLNFKKQKQMDELHSLSGFVGFITSLGGKNSHTAILAKSMQIPAVVGCDSSIQIINQGDLIIIDGLQNTVLINPSQVILEDYQWRRAQYLHEKKRLERIRHIPTQTIDGIGVQLMANIEMPQDCEGLAKSGIDGVGLFRSEFIFLQSDDLPDEETQFQAYQQAVLALNGLPMTIRTIDIGVDKQIKSVDSSPSPLGLRAIRWSLSEPEIFQTQLRAILRASAFGRVQILLPMISHVSEVTTCRLHLKKAMHDLTQKNIAFDPHIPLGVMVEIPATAFALPMFFQTVDFLSIGTNDLMQYMLAVDRQETQLMHLYNPEHPAVLHLLAHVIQLANLAQKPVAICGELAGDVRLTRLLLAFGLRCFSMHASQFLNIKSQILNTQLADIKAIAQDILNTYDSEKISALIGKMNKM